MLLSNNMSTGEARWAAVSLVIWRSISGFKIENNHKKLTWYWIII